MTTDRARARDRIDKNLTFSLESASPIRIVRNDLYWCLVGHGLHIDLGNSLTDRATLRAL